MPILNTKVGKPKPQNNQMSVEQEISMLFDLGHKLHKDKRYFDAFKAWTVAHGKYNGNFDIPSAEMIIYNIINKKLPEFTHGDTGKDLIFIVGMPRSGTTLLEQVLGTHDNIIPHGELRGMVNALDIWLQNDFSLDKDKCNQIRYLYRQDAPLDGNYHVDKMPRNFLSINVIKSVFPDSKIINIKRDKFSTCMSIYASNFSEFTPYCHRWETLNIMYKMYEDLINVLNPFTVHYENIIDNFDNEINKVFNYIGLEMTGKEKEFYKNKYEILTCSKDQVKKPLYKNANSNWEPYKEFLR